MTEILAPAGAEEQLVAAVRSGADAVYLGTKNFNARSSAGNFDAAALKSAVAYCHARGVKVHVTLNTLVNDEELNALKNEIVSIAESGVDAVIVQDLAVAKFLREICPSVERHASTQMTLHNPEGVRGAKQLGFSRAVLARELSKKEIRRIAESTDLEIESFVHGALCMSASGACYLSSMIGGRSGNRGKCAQPCRLDFRLGEKNYALSLKDMSYVEHVRELAEAGVCSFKIEGRMKRPEYVASAVNAVKTALTGEKPDMKFLRAVFSRSGFTDGYYTAKRNASMFGIRTKEDVRAAGDALGAAANLYRNEYQRIPLDFALYLQEEKPSMLMATDGEHSVTVTGESPQRALKVALSAESAERNLAKLGGTPFAFRSFTLEAQEGLTLSASVLNALRREAAEKLLALRGEILPHKVREYSFLAAPHQAGKQMVRLRFANYDQVFDNNAEQVILPLSVLKKHSEELLQRFGERIVCEIPILSYDTQRLREELSELKNAGVEKIYAENLGAVILAKELGFAVYGGSGLNIMNTPALEEYEKLGLEDAVVSFELSAKRIAKLGGEMKRGVLAYGRMPLMQLRACPARGEKGCEKNCSGGKELTDRKNMTFPMLCHERQFTTLYNSLPMYIGDKKNSFPVDFFTLYYTNETKKQAKAAYESFLNGEDFAEERTRGLYFREIE